MRWVLAAIVLGWGGVSASPAAADAVLATAAPEVPGKNLFYVEALGKAGLYGVGFERTLTSRLALGVAGSFAVVRDQQLTTLSPYAAPRACAPALRSLRHPLRFGHPCRA